MIGAVGGTLGAVGGILPGASSAAGSLTVTETNYVANPRFANNRQNWSLAGGVAGSPVVPTWPLNITADKAPNTLLTQQAPASGGLTANPYEVWTGGFVATVPADAPGPVAIRADVFFTGKTVAGPSVTIQPGKSARLIASGAGPSTVGASVFLRVYAGSATIPTGSRVTLSDPFLYKGTIPATYFHGSSTNTPGVTHSWVGAVDNSHSRRVTIHPALPYDPTPTVVAVSSADVPQVLSLDRSRLWNAAGSTLRETMDGTTWTTLRTFTGESIEAVHELHGGDLLVFTQNAGLDRRRVYRSEGYPNAGTITWTQVMESRAHGIKFTSAWSVSRHDGPSTVLFGEYGPKFGEVWNGQTVASGENARYVFSSADNGRTFTTVFDLNAHLTSLGRALNGQHVHGVAWDPWWERIWVSYGDNTDAIVYSDTGGSTWNVAAGTAALSSPTQVVGILPMPDAILFGSDTGPSGVLRIDRAEGQGAPSYTLHTAYVPADPGHLCQAIQRPAAPGEPALFGFCAEGKPARSYVVATLDGYTFTRLWRDPAEQAAGWGTRSVAGPTRDGRVFIGSNDQKVAGQWSLVTVDLS